MNRGFTLIEIVIAVTIMAFIAIFTSRMVTQGVQARSKVERALESSVAVRNALSVMSRDIEMAFNYRDFDTEVYNKAQTERRNKITGGGADGSDNDDGKDQGGGNGQGGRRGRGGGAPGGGAGVSPDELDEKYPLRETKIYTKFIGEPDKINLSSLNNFRARRDSKVSDQAEIGYSLRNCTSRTDPNKSSQCLWRRVSPYIDDKIDEGGKETVLIENVKSLSFRYLGPGEEETWLETWRSDEQGSENSKNKFPYAVEITLVAVDQSTEPPRDVSMTVVAELRFPNNKPDEKSAPVN